MEPWYKIAMPRKEVRKGRPFDPDEVATAPSALYRQR